jgi:ferric-dicitrate binding protein FerR (iron transport regulator)
MHPIPANTREEIALGWIMRLQDPAFDRWPELSEWLAEDEENSILFDRLCIADRAVAEELRGTAAPRRRVWPERDDTPAARAHRSSERAWIAAAALVLIATLLFVLVVLPSLRPGQPASVAAPRG